MSNKAFAIVIIIILLIVLGPILLVCFWEVENDTSIMPTLSFTLSTEEPEQEKVTVTAVARTTDSNGILAITLPDSSVVYTDVTDYVITQNGTYRFEVEAKNGQKVSNELEVTNIREYSSTNPYMPNGFSHLEGDVAGGYVIQDKMGNQYVWIPVEKETLTRKMSENKDYSEPEETIEEFMESVNQYCGFYMARYETSIFQKEGKEQYIASSMPNKLPWTNINYSVAQTVSQNSYKEFGYEDCKTSIINSYAWDTVISWLDSTMANYSTNLSYGNYSGQIFYTGATVTDMINNICDMAGNVKEWTSESYTENAKSTNQFRVIRGGNANLNKTASSRTIYDISKMESNLGFRMILYKSISDDKSKLTETSEM